MIGQSGRLDASDWLIVPRWLWKSIPNVIRLRDVMNTSFQKVRHLCSQASLTHKLTRLAPMKTFPHMGLPAGGTFKPFPILDNNVLYDNEDDLYLFAFHIMKFGEP